ncbi:hypothetical protein BKA70DRAFT_1218265 [Coprinopsis sp. MPI-PUGE-AT-0042]|nr:hypothetical protein BKA70DRAFT_1218265 [Coprinopsis sp. MPI-PUGE-AT-0042]
MRLATFLFFAFFLGIASALGLSADAKPDSRTCLPPRRVKKGLDWVYANYASSDGREPDYFDKFVGANTLIYFGPGPPSQGREVLRALLTWQWSATTSISHDLEEVFILEDLSIIQTTATYTYTDGTVLKASAYTIQVKKPEDQYPTEVRVYGDFNASFAKFTEIAGPPPSSS